MASSRYSFDAVIIGGGIAGLWVLNRLSNRGYNAVLLESRALGSYQTVASQGMIHGGIKYTLSGALTGASEAIADMPDHWRACLQGKGDVDLRRARTLSDHFYLWSTASLTSRLGGFLASKATRGRVDKVASSDLPPLFQDKRFKGSLYRLVDMVMDTTSVLEALADNCRNQLYKIDESQLRWQRNSDATSLIIGSGDDELTVDARAIILCAGKGNGPLLEAAGASAPQMQLRPLQQVMVKHNHPHRFFGHCVTADKTPRLTISSHPMADGSQVWYLGGTLAEKGASQSSREVIAHARRELAELMPWVDLGDARWASLPVDRAEPKQRQLARPDKAFADWAEGPANVMAAWPTKLTLSPNLADEVETRLREQGIDPSRTSGNRLPLPSPEISPTPWQEAFGNET